MVFMAIFGRDLHFPIYWILYRVRMRFFRHVQKSSLIWKYDLRFPSTWILSNEQKKCLRGKIWTFESDFER